jgi:hypothetical protein
MKLILLFLFTLLCKEAISEATQSYRSNSISTPHGTFYGFREIDPESYIYRNQYRTTATGPSSFLTNAIFYGHEIRFGNTMHDMRTYIPWSEEKDEQWRATTKAPYFDNKIPQSQDILPAAVVDGKLNYSWGV